jgi:hypothetical protein
MPSGEVMPSGEGVGAPPTVPTWASAGPGESATASAAAIMNRAISTAPNAAPGPRVNASFAREVLGTTWVSGER